MILRGHIWYVRIRKSIKGRPHEWAISLNTKEKNIALLRAQQVLEIKDEIIDGAKIIFPWQKGNDTVSPIYKRIKVSDAVIKYIENKRMDRVNPVRSSTIDMYLSQLNDFSKSFRHRNICSITQQDIKRYIQILSKELKPSSVNLKISILKQFFQFCRIERMNLNDIELKKVKVTGDHRPRYISDANWEKIMQNIDADLQCVFYTYRRLGLRISEVFNSRIEEDNWLIVDSNLTKSGKTIEILLSASDKQAIEYLKLSEIKPAKLARIFKQAGKAAGLNVHFHMIRHTTAIHTLIKHDFNIYRVKEKLNHSSIVTSEMYLNYSQRRLQYDFPTLFNN